MRNPKMSRLLSIPMGSALALILSSGVAAQSSAPSPSSSQPDATASPTQSAPATPAPAAQAPTTQAPPAGSQPQTNTQSGGSASIDDELQLTPDQKQKIAAVVDDENKQISTVRDDNSMTLEQKQQKVLAIRQAGTPKIKAVLTPDQLQKLAAIQQRMREQQGQPAQNSAPPQK